MYNNDPAAASAAELLARSQAADGAASSSESADWDYSTNLGEGGGVYLSGRGFHSSTHPLNLSRFCYCSSPYNGHLPPDNGHMNPV
jgi:hypothetical protein